MEMMRKLSDHNLLIGETENEKESEREMIREMMNFKFFNKEDFNIFVNIVNRLDWSINLEIEADDIVHLQDA